MVSETVFTLRSNGDGIESDMQQMPNNLFDPIGRGYSTFRVCAAIIKRIKFTKCVKPGFQSCIALFSNELNPAGFDYQRAEEA